LTAAGADAAVDGAVDAPLLGAVDAATEAGACDAGAGLAAPVHALNTTAAAAATAKTGLIVILFSSTPLAGASSIAGDRVARDLPNDTPSAALRVHRFAAIRATA